MRKHVRVNAGIWKSQRKTDRRSVFACGDSRVKKEMMGWNKVYLVNCHRNSGP